MEVFSSSITQILIQCEEVSNGGSCFFTVEASISDVHLNFTQNYAGQAGEMFYGESFIFCDFKINFTYDGFKLFIIQIPPLI